MKAREKQHHGVTKLWIQTDNTRGNHMMSPEFIWFHPGLLNGGYIILIELP
eukprot:SAG22_NODE_21994_length_252_cov_0.718954_1_plen_50_part_10